MPEGGPAGRVGLLALLGSLLWIGLGLWAGARDGVDLRQLTPFEGLVLASQLLVVPALLFAAVAAFRRLATPTPDPALAAMADGEAMEARLAGLASRLSAIRDQMGDDMGRVETLTRGIEARSAAAAASLGEAIRQLAAVEHAGAALSERLADCTGAAEGIAVRLASLTDSAGAVASRVRDVGEAAQSLAAAARAEAEQLASAVAGLEAQARSARNETEGALALVASATDAQVRQLTAATTEARAQLSAIGAEAARALGRHLDGLVAQARELEARLSAQANATELLAVTAEKGFQRLDARLDHSAATSSATLDQLKARLEGLSAAIDGLADPLRTARGAVGDLGASVESLEAGAGRALQAFAETLPSRTDDARATAAELDQVVRTLLAAIDAAHARAAELDAPLRANAATLDAAAQKFAEQREAIGFAGEALVVELEQARQLISEVEQATEASSIAAATRLVEALGRVRDVSSQATGTMRAMLEGLVEEAREALAQAADRALGERFTARIAAEAGEAEARARAAAERSAASLAALAGALKLVDSKSDEKREALAQASEKDLAATAALVTERLAAESITLGAALGRDMTADDWARWRKGERSLFGRRTFALLEKREAGEIRALAARDPDFAAAASRLMAGVDALLQRIDARALPGLSDLVRDSSAGRMAALLSEALED